MIDGSPTRSSNGPRPSCAVCPQLRTHSGCPGRPKIAASIAELVSPIRSLAGGDGVIVAGHGRLGSPETVWPWCRSWCSTILTILPFARRALVIADNRIAENAGWDEAGAPSRTAALQDDHRIWPDRIPTPMPGSPICWPVKRPRGDTLMRMRFQTTLASSHARRCLDLYGEHRVVCGDATDADAIAMVLGDEIADMVFTDPPYNVNYANSVGQKGQDRAILNDNHDTGFYDFPAGGTGRPPWRIARGIYVHVIQRTGIGCRRRSAAAVTGRPVIWAEPLPGPG